MKTIQFLAGCIVVLGLCGVARADSYVKVGSATVVRVQGEARYSMDDGKHWHPLVAGKILGAGAVIKTEADSTADLILSGNRGKSAQKRPLRA